MKDLPIIRCLNECTEKERIFSKSGDVYSLHVKNGEAIFTDTNDFSKIYAVMSLDFFNRNQ